MTTSEPSGKSAYRIWQRPYLWITVMTAYALILSASFIAYLVADQYNPIPSFYEPTEEAADELTAYHSGKVPAFLTTIALMGGISLATLISIPSGIIILLGKYRAAVPAIIALVIWALVWVVYSAISNSIIPVLGLIGTVIVIVLGITGMKKIGDLS